ncbi:hypothetical protein BDN72DRAFT_187955 [Pluteus cervinus]|uniref:Uncharacterized protein n=1 Tax=Pluteus cervinus TaxID=181527 RepID=A0ACD3ALA6_9AGAR|nr:hypothetical protein BDN72DRAFT_187955 [Pluteus cervinus]
MQQCGSQEHEASAKLRGEIDAELAILYERVRILHAKRNTISPLYRLPSEIFIRIFIEYQYLVIDDQNLRTRKAYKVWIRILQLSQYLRRIGLESPELWSNITRTDRRWVSKFIERSRSNDLRVGMFVYEEASVDLFKQVMANSDRISTLSISTSLRCWEDVIPALKSPAPRLIALKLYLHGASIPVDLFPESFSKLKNLGVTSCNVDLKHPLFTQTNLTALSITSPTSAIRTTDILHLLERLPALRSLWLSHALQVAGDGRYMVSLPHLTSLDLRHPDLDTNKNFLTSIRLPENVDISLYSNKIERGTQNLIADVMDSVKLALQKTSLVFRDLTVNRIDCESGVSMTCTKQPRCQSGVRSSPFVDVDLRFTKAGHGPHAERRMAHQITPVAARST